jgi:hypothetical protein
LHSSLRKDSRFALVHQFILVRTKTRAARSLHQQNSLRALRVFLHCCSRSALAEKFYSRSYKDSRCALATQQNSSSRALRARLLEFCKNTLLALRARNAFFFCITARAKKKSFPSGFEPPTFHQIFLFLNRYTILPKPGPQTDGQTHGRNKVVKVPHSIPSECKEQKFTLSPP